MMKKKQYPKKYYATTASTPLLDASFVQKATKIELAAGISASSIGSETARLKPEGNPPTGERRWTTAVQWRERWTECVCHAERFDVLRAMDKQLGVQVVDRSRVRGTVEWKLRLAKDKRASAVVAATEDISASRVRQFRMDLAAGRLFEKE
jgi:hypothetical protein